MEKQRALRCRRATAIPFAKRIRDLTCRLSLHVRTQRARSCPRWHVRGWRRCPPTGAEAGAAGAPPTFEGREHFHKLSWGWAGGSRGRRRGGRSSAAGAGPPAPGPALADGAFAEPTRRAFNRFSGKKTEALASAERQDGRRHRIPTKELGRPACCLSCSLPGAAAWRYQAPCRFPNGRALRHWPHVTCVASLSCQCCPQGLKRTPDPESPTSHIPPRCPWPLHLQLSPLFWVLPSNGRRAGSLAPTPRSPSELQRMAGSSKEAPKYTTATSKGVQGSSPDPYPSMASALYLVSPSLVPQRCQVKH